MSTSYSDSNSDLCDYIENYLDNVEDARFYVLENQASITEHTRHVFKICACAISWLVTVAMYLLTWKLGIPELMCCALWVVLFPLVSFLYSRIR